ncbi:hypothetical protein [Psychromonas sp.]|uniref:hypothetical protein n=1 Tax=Psychromonas sp. TaxID=1884585 RepID=UPI0035615D46
MKVSGIDIGSNIEKIKQPIEADNTLSPSMRTTLDLLLLIVNLLCQRLGLNREILNTAPAMTLNLLRCKAEEAIFRRSRRALAGAVFLTIWRSSSDLLKYQQSKLNQVKPSQTCPDCGAKKKKTLAERCHSCGCGCEKPRDVASAQVNLNWALGTQAGNPPKRVA